MGVERGNSTRLKKYPETNPIGAVGDSMKKILIEIMNDVDEWLTARPLGSMDEKRECVNAIRHHLNRARNTIQYLYDIDYISYKDYTESMKSFTQVYNHWVQNVWSEYN